jgi:hypothetical protein
LWGHGPSRGRGRRSGIALDFSQGTSYKDVRQSLPASGWEIQRRTLVGVGCSHSFALLGMANQTKSNRNAFAREKALIIAVGQLPNLSQGLGRQVGALEDLDGYVAGEDPKLLLVDTSEDLADKSELLWRRRE